MELTKLTEHRTFTAPKVSTMTNDLAQGTVNDCISDVADSPYLQSTLCWLSVCATLAMDRVTASGLPDALR